MATTFEIHPSIGIARVGNESRTISSAPSRTHLAAAPQYRDAAGGLLRQAARFRVFECERDDNNVLLGCREVTPDLGTIEWTVHLANTKAAGPKFLPQRRRCRAGVTKSVKRPRRDELKIDPGPRTVDHGPNPVASFDTGACSAATRAGAAGRDPHRWTPGGCSSSAASESPSSVPEGRTIENFADNDNWFDDVSDGPVRAVVTTADGRTRAAKPLVGDRRPAGLRAGDHEFRHACMTSPATSPCSEDG